MIDIHQLNYAKHSHIYEDRKHHSVDLIENHQKIVDRQFIENNHYWPIMVFPDEKLSQLKLKDTNVCKDSKDPIQQEAEEKNRMSKSFHNIITPFAVIEDNLFDHKPNFLSTKFGGVRVVKTKNYDNANKRALANKLNKLKINVSASAEEKNLE